MKKLYVVIVSVVAMAGAILFNLAGTSAQAALPRDCDNNSIIHCGATSTSELSQRYNENATGDLATIYNSYGISAGDITSSNAKMGEVTKDGRVIVDGKTVATDAMSIGRQDIFSGSTQKNIGGKTFYETPPSRSFISDSIAAHVFFDENGQFKAAILTSCGNPVTGHPPKPVYKCESLTKTKISRTEYSFTAAASATNGASIIDYTYNFGDGETITSAETTVDHTYTKPGTYTATVTVNVKVGNQTKSVTGPKCKVEVKVETPPAEPVYRCDSLTSRVIKLEDRHYAFDLAYTAEGGATLQSVDYDFGDGQSVTNLTGDGAKTVEHKYAKAGSYNTTATLHFKAPGSDTVVDKKCAVGVSPAQEMCPQNPSLPKGDAGCSTPLELPRTGPMDMISGGLGLSAIIASGYYWFASRRGLLAAFMQQ